jgi:hypothetical protein
LNYTSTLKLRNRSGSLYPPGLLIAADEVIE